jgi:hypothetical protein
MSFLSDRCGLSSRRILPQCQSLPKYNLTLPPSPTESAGTTKLTLFTSPSPSPSFPLTDQIGSNSESTPCCYLVLEPDWPRIGPNHLDFKHNSGNGRPYILDPWHRRGARGGRSALSTMVIIIYYAGTYTFLNSELPLPSDAVS